MSDIDGQGRVRKAVYPAPEIWARPGAIAERDGTSRSDLLEGIVPVAIDEEELVGMCRPVVTVKVAAGVL